LLDEKNFDFAHLNDTLLQLKQNLIA